MLTMLSLGRCFDSSFPGSAEFGSTNFIPISSEHDHTIPDFNLPGYGPLVDYTDAGVLWDPTLSAYYYSYDVDSNIYTAYDASYPTNWLYYIGQWGDEQYPTSDPRQMELFGISATAKYTSGPTGPEDKDLNRTSVCPDNGNPCGVLPVLTA